MKQYYIAALGSSVKIPHSTLSFAQLALQYVYKQNEKLCKNIFGVESSNLYIIHV